MIAGGGGRRVPAVFAPQGIMAFRAGTPSVLVEESVAAYLDGRLTAMPRVCEHHGHHYHEHDDPGENRVTR
ncbi:MAG TPA: hypothetical protein VFY06_10965 [Verrucomicrobiae bacterium]|nr:hypothetical protein [Verrucomicrobiae bacterium]